ncbi:MAG: hypothetical protein LCI02_07210 [Proteobacteria bacterium]|nr:hypothetical protein [Pseudomonadota bacterium]
MDVQFPYADGGSRRRLLYRLPSTPAPRRLLIVCTDAEQARIGDDWGAPVQVLAPSALAAERQQGPARFDAVALPALLDRPSAVDTGELLASVRYLLAPAGVVVGHVAHALALRSMASPRGMAGALAALLQPQAIDRAGGCRRRLLGAGFVAPQCFYVQPAIEDPMGLIPAQGPAARAHFVQSVRSTRELHHVLGHVPRLLMAHGGLGGMMQAQLFFWARRP